MNNHYYVIGGSYGEMFEYTKQKSPNTNHIWIFDAIAITEENPTGVFIGTWKDRPDILDILDRLIELTTDVKKRVLFHDLKIQYRIL